MSDIDVNLDSADLPIIVEALEAMKASLLHADEADSTHQHPTVLQINLLINTFKSAQP